MVSEYSNCLSSDTHKDGFILASEDTIQPQLSSKNLLPPIWGN